MGNAIGWFEIVGPEPEKTAAFYAELFGWHTETTEGGSYILIDTHSGKGMNGGFVEPPPKGHPGSIIYVQGPDVQAMLDRAESLGGTTRMPVTKMAMVTYAMFTDPWGNRIGLMEGDGDAPVSAGDNPPVDWVEIGCGEPEKAFTSTGTCSAGRSRPTWPARTAVRSTVRSLRARRAARAAGSAARATASRASTSTRTSTTSRSTSSARRGWTARS